MAVSVWEALFMLVVLKIPVAYLGIVVWWAVRAEPATGSIGDHPPGAYVPLEPCGWDDRRRRQSARRGRPPIRPTGGRRRSRRVVSRAAA